jgi:peptidoglycan/xylan/chitin deacetylase (PgdA/CDA1 family)
MGVELLRKSVNFTAGLLERTGLLRARFQSVGRLRILCYHGVCADADVEQAWVPSFFVSASRLAEHMEMLHRFGPIVYLPEYFAHPQRTDPPCGACTAVTFDDVPACAYVHALPVLRRYDIRASFFISTGHARSGRLFAADVLHLIGCYPELVSPGVRQSLATLLAEPARHKRMSLDMQQMMIAEAEAMVRREAPAHIVEALRCANWDEVRAIAAAGHEIGGHTVDHAILGYQEKTQRRTQIAQCAVDIATEVGQRPVGFAYPNGGPGDFDPQDERWIEECGFKYALSTQPGAVRPDSSRFALPRCGVSMSRRAGVLGMELTGALDRRRLAQHGWDADFSREVVL